MTIEHASTEERSRALLAERAARLAAAHADIDDDTTAPATLVVTVGDQRMALPTADVAALLPPAPITQLPPIGRLLGVIRVRGHVVPVADLGELVGVSSQLPLHDRPIVLLSDGDDALGVLVDAAALVADVQDPLDGPPVDEREDSPVAGISADGTFVLDAARILAHPDLTSHVRDDTEGAP